MKKFLISSVFFLVAFFPLVAQELISEEVPEEFLTLKKGNLPPNVIKAAEELFKGNTQIKWGVFPYELKDYGWVVNKDNNEPIDRYEISMKAKDGSDVFAVFEANGELIRYRMVHKDEALPSKVLNAIAKTEYKDWKLVGETEVVKSNQKKIVDHYIVKMKNGNKKKNLYYSFNGDMLMNK
jgi:hypothetical protein